MHRLSLRLFRKTLGSDSQDALTSLSNLGLVLHHQGKYEEAEAMHLQALAGYEKVLGPEHPDTLTSINNLGIALFQLGKYEEAEAVHRRALAGKEKVLGADHPDTQTSMWNLSQTLKGQSRQLESRYSMNPNAGISNLLPSPTSPSNKSSITRTPTSRQRSSSSNLRQQRPMSKQQQRHISVASHKSTPNGTGTQTNRKPASVASRKSIVSRVFGR